MSRVRDANEAFEKGWISKQEYAGILHKEGQLSDQEFAGFQPKPPLGERVRGAARRAGEQISEGAEAMQRRAAGVGREALGAAEVGARGILGPIRAAAEDLGPAVTRLGDVPIPGMRRLREALEMGPGMGARAAERAAARGERFPALRGVVAGAPLTGAAAVTPTPETLRELTVMGATLAAPPAARAVLPRVFPILGRPVSAVGRALRQWIFGRRPITPKQAARMKAAGVTPEAAEPIEVFPGAVPAPRRPGLRRRARPEAAPERAPEALPALPAPPGAPAGIPAPVEGPGFRMVSPGQAPPRRTFTPEIGEGFLPPETAPEPAAAVMRRLGLAPFKKPGEPVAPRAAVKPTKRRANELLKDPELINTPAKVAEVKALVDAGKVPQKRVDALQTRLTSKYVTLAEALGPEHARAQTALQSLQAFGLRAPRITQPPAGAAPAAPIQPPAPTSAPQPGPLPPAPANVEMDFAPPQMGPGKEAALEARSQQIDGLIRRMEAGENVPQAEIDPFPEVERHFQRKVGEELEREIDADLKAQGFSNTPILDIFRKRKVKPESYNEYRGELEFLGKEVIISEKGSTVPEIMEDAYNTGLLAESTEAELFRHGEHEKRTGRRAPFVPLRGAAAGGRGGFLGFKPKGPPPPEEPLERLQSGYEKNIRESTGQQVWMPPGEYFDKLYTDFVDRTNPINNLERYKKEAPDFINLEMLTRRWMGNAGIAEAGLRMRTSLLGKDANAIDTGEGLQWIFRDAEARGLFRPLQTYMVALRDVELAQQGKKGLDAAKAAEIIPFLKQKHGPIIQGLAERWFDWRVRTYLDPVLDVGGMTQGLYDLFRRGGQFYGPFQRVMEDLDQHGSVVSRGGQLFTPTSTPFKKFKGSDRPIYSPAETDIQMAYFFADYVERVRIGNAIWESRAYSKELAKEIQEVKAGIVKLDRSKGGEPIFARSLYPPEKNAIPFLKKGKLHWMRVPSDVAKAIHEMRAQDMGLGMKLFSYPAKLLRAGVVLDPAFSLGRNLPRDIVTAAILTKYGITPSNLVKGLFSAITGSDDLHFKWMASGADMATMMAIDRAGANVRLSQLRGTRELQELGPIELLQKLTEISEQTTRKGIYDRAKGKGASDLEAMYESRTGTVDFGNQGASAFSRWLRIAVPFHGASTSGLATLGKAFRRRPWTTTRRAILGITIPSIILWAARQDDEELQEIPQWEKDAFWIGRFPGTDRIWRLPKPHELGLLFGTSIEHILDYIAKNDPAAIRTLIHRIMDTTAPPVIPPLFKVSAELWANKSTFTNKPVVPKQAARLDPEFQYGEYTSETAKEIGRRLKISPSKIDHVVRGTAGTLGRTTVSISDAMLRRLKIVDAPEAPTGGGPLEGILFAKPPIGARSESVNRFFDLWEELEREHATKLSQTSFQVRPSQLLSSIRRAKKRMTALRDANQMARKSRFMNPEQKKEFIQKRNERITAIARQVVKSVERRRRDLRQAP